eukprot:scaffold2153_cov131-Cylindrotheca_fusiformis.AAC.10
MFFLYSEHCSSPLGCDHSSSDVDDNDSTMGDSSADDTSWTDNDDDENLTRESAHSEDSVSALSATFNEDFEDFDPSESNVEDSCDSEFGETITSTDDDFTCLSFVSDDFFDLDAFEEDDQEESSLVTMGRSICISPKLELSRWTMKQVQVQIKEQQDKLPLNWHDTEAPRKRRTEGNKKTGQKRAQTDCLSLRSVSWHTSDDSWQRQEARVGDYRDYRSLSGVRKTSKGMRRNYVLPHTVPTKYGRLHSWSVSSLVSADTRI